MTIKPPECKSDPTGIDKTWQERKTMRCKYCAIPNCLVIKEEPTDDVWRHNCPGAPGVPAGVRLLTNVTSCLHCGAVRPAPAGDTVVTEQVWSHYCSVKVGRPIVVTPAPACPDCGWVAAGSNLAMDAAPSRLEAAAAMSAPEGFEYRGPMLEVASESLTGHDFNPLATQVAGSHYKDMAIQPVEFITKNKLGFLEGCVIKRVCRWRAKDGVQDLRKAIHELELLIELEGGE